MRMGLSGKFLSSACLLQSLFLEPDLPVYGTSSEPQSTVDNVLHRLSDLFPLQLRFKSLLGTPRVTLT